MLLLMCIDDYVVAAADCSVVSGDAAVEVDVAVAVVVDSVDAVDNYAVVDDVFCLSLLCGC